MPKSYNDLVLNALQYYGQEAIPGKSSNPVILGFFQETGRPDIAEDEIPWCSAFLNAMAKKVGAEHPDSLSARSWLNVGQKVESPSFGNIVVFWRESPESAFGHVGIVIAKYPGRLYILGGNQNNEVCVECWSEEKVLGYRKII